MNCNILTTPQFAKDIKRLNKKFKNIKKDLSKLIETLEHNPMEGTALGNGCYKIRLANSSIPTGKSGGFRVISYFIDEENNLYLLSIYSKTEKETISDSELEAILNGLSS